MFFRSNFLAVRLQARAFITLFGILSRPWRKIHCCTSRTFSFLLYPRGDDNGQGRDEKGSTEPEAVCFSTSITTSLITRGSFDPPRDPERKKQPFSGYSIIPRLSIIRLIVSLARTCTNVFSLLTTCDFSQHFVSLE